MPELVADAKRTPRPFSRVICENINRLARNPAVAYGLDDELRALGIRIHAADEPFEESFASIVLRHVNVGLACGSHFELLQKSREGAETNVRQGWHGGGTAPYGYQLIPQPHPNPHKARQRLVKNRMDLDPVRAPVVRRIFDEYLYGTRGVREIRDLLNTDPGHFPPPVPPNPDRGLGAWSSTTIWGILRNPKYTGYAVWNRKARKTGRGRRNAPTQWIWSDAPAHPAIITRIEYDQVGVKAAHNTRSRRTHDPTARASCAPTSSGIKTAAISSGRGRTLYVFRGLLTCGLCGLRMWGNRRHRSRYYTCQPDRSRPARIPPGHPPVVYVGEAPLLAAVTGYLASTIYGPERLEYWQRALAAADRPDPAAPVRDHVGELKAEIAQLDRQLRQQLVSLEAPEVSQSFRQLVADRIDELQTQRAHRQAMLRALERTHKPAPADRTHSMEVLARLPLRANDLIAAPHSELRGIFESLQLGCVYDPQRHAVTIYITLACSAEE